MPSLDAVLEGSGLCPREVSTADKGERETQESKQGDSHFKLMRTGSPAIRFAVMFRRLCGREYDNFSKWVSSTG